MGAGLYPPPIDKTRPLGVVYYNTLGSTAYIGNTETRAYLATFNGAPGRLYRVTLNLAIVDSDSNNATYRGAMQSATIRARWAYGTDATVASTDMGAFYASTFTDDSLSGSGTVHSWFIGSASLTPGPISVAITLEATRAPATGTGALGQVRVLTGGGNTTTLQIEDIGGYPTPNLV